MKTLFAAWALAQAASAQNVTPEVSGRLFDAGMYVLYADPYTQEFCKNKGSDLKPVMESDGTFNGNCIRTESAGMLYPARSPNQTGSGWRSRHEI